MAKSLDKKNEATELIEHGLKYWLRQPRPKISEREWEAIKWRWEWLRLNADYEKEYLDIEEQKKPKVLPQFNKWGLGEWFDSKLSFEELYTQILNEISELKMHGIDVDETAKYLLFLRWERPSTRVALSYVFSNEVIMDIDLDVPDSENIEKFTNWLHKIKAQTNRRVPWDKLRKYHKAITLKIQGKTLDEIVEIIFPEVRPSSYDESEKAIDIEDARRKVYRYLERGKELIQGGYKLIK